MLYPFLTAPDETEISYSEVLHKGNHPEVRVYVEKWDDDRHAFNSLELYLPAGRITKCEGFSKKEAQKTSIIFCISKILSGSKLKKISLPIPV